MYVAKLPEMELSDQAAFDQVGFQQKHLGCARNKYSAHISLQFSAKQSA